MGEAMDQTEPMRKPIPVNFDQMRDRVGVGIRRASAFLNIGLHAVRDIESIGFGIDAGTIYHFWPEDLPEGVKNEVATEYEAWLLGSCLKELDIFYSLFLDEVWFAIQLLSLHGKPLSTEQKFDEKFAKNTNVANKQKIIAEKLLIDDHYDQLNSLSLARNCLTHAAGIVRRGFDCNNENRDMLVLRWRAMDTYAVRSGVEIKMVSFPFDTWQLPGEGEIQIVMRFNDQSQVFPADSKVVLDQTVIAQLCLFYDIICNEVIQGCMNLYRKNGIEVPVKTTEIGP